MPLVTARQPPIDDDVSRLADAPRSLTRLNVGRIPVGIDNHNAIGANQIDAQPTLVVSTNRNTSSSLLN